MTISIYVGIMYKRCGFLFSFPNTELTLYLRNLLFSPTVKPLSFLRLKQSFYQFDNQTPSYVFLKTPQNLVLSIARRSLASPQKMHAHSMAALLRRDSSFGPASQHLTGNKNNPKGCFSRSCQRVIALSPPTQSNFGSWWLPASKY